MRDSDRKLGMDRQITRRDVIQGFGVLGAGLMLPGVLPGCSKTQLDDANYYPPELMGLRGNHDGALAMVESAVEQAHRATIELLGI